jgi:hypothetical protein
MGYDSHGREFYMTNGAMKDLPQIRAKGTPREAERDGEAPMMMFQEYLRVLRDAKEGALKSLERRLIFSFPDTREELYEDNEFPVGFVPVSGSVGVGVGRFNGGRLNLVDEGGMEVDIPFHEIFRAYEGNPNVIFEELHEAFGGKLYLGRRLCFKDSVEISKPCYAITVPWRNDGIRPKDSATFHVRLRSAGDIWEEVESSEDGLDDEEGLLAAGSSDESSTEDSEDENEGREE